MNTHLFKNIDLYSSILDDMFEAIYVWDTEQRVLYLNKRAQIRDGVRLEEVKGKKLSEVYTIPNRASLTDTALKTQKSTEYEVISYSVGQKNLVCVSKAAPIFQDSSLVGAYCICHDISFFSDTLEQNLTLQRSHASDKNLFLSSNQEAGHPFEQMIGSSKIFTRCKELAKAAAKTDSSVMLIGRTGSGKEVFARAIHNSSDRAKEPFLALNCAAIPESLIESILFGTTKGIYTGAIEKEGLLLKANGGTVFLDEINSMPLISQAKILRVLEERKVMKLGSPEETDIDIRVISSTNELPMEAIANGHLREDLFYRLAVMQVSIPSLCERLEDIPELIQSFIESNNQRFGKNIKGVAPEVMEQFLTYSWPGNVRQLKTCIESAMHLAKDNTYIHISDLPPYVLEMITASKPLDASLAASAPLKESDMKESPETADSPDACTRDFFRQKEREEMIDALWRARGNITKAAEILGISRQLFSYRMKKHNLKR